MVQSERHIGESRLGRTKRHINPIEAVKWMYQSDETI